MTFRIREQKRRATLSFVLLLGVFALTPVAHAGEMTTLERLKKVEAELDRQASVIEAQQQELRLLRQERDSVLEAIRAGAAPGLRRDPHISALDQVPNAITERPSVAPVAVGERPLSTDDAELAALPPGMGVLTPRGRFIVDPSVEYVRTSNNRLVFRGVEIVPGVQLGVIEASDAARDTGVVTLSTRYGLTNRLEVEARVPYVGRHDRVTTLAQRDQAVTQNKILEGQDIGDVEFAARYQINTGQDGLPIFVATSRVKPPTGTGPYDVDYDEFGVATSLPTGSGFWGAEAGMTMLYPSDPAIIFGGITYLHNFPRDINRQVGGVFVGRVEPGDSIGASLGFGLSLNPRFSVSFGYSHNYIFETKSELGTTQQSSQPLQAGSLLMGWSFRLNDRITLNNSFEFGVTSDAPDMRVVVRAPFRF
jgi:hypothetical protein